jgi:hypothetical protein
MMRENLEGSQYANTDVNDYYLDLWVKVDVPVSIYDKKITLEPRHHERPDMLSFEMYGTKDYWWVFMQRNQDLIFDPIYDFKAGMEIYVPEMGDVG